MIVVLRFLSIDTPAKIRIGNTVAHSIPNLRFPPNTPVINPARAGPDEQPKSPPNAQSANIVVPPDFTRSDANEIVPGQNTPTENPHSIQPKSPTAGIVDVPIYT